MAISAKFNIHREPSVGSAPSSPSERSPASPQQHIDELCRRMIEAVGENPERPELLRTPERFRESMLEMTSGYRQTAEEIVRGAIFDESSAQMILVKRIEFYSLCEHHVLPFFGRAHVAYLPKGKVLGLSRIPQMVNLFARRLQIQERLTDQIADGIDGVLSPSGVICMLEARHLCMMMRGVQSHSPVMTTVAMRGAFEREPGLRHDFYRLLEAERFPAAG